jgi:hypothetical protein
MGKVCGMNGTGTGMYMVCRADSLTDICEPTV